MIVVLDYARTRIMNSSKNIFSSSEEQSDESRSTIKVHMFKQWKWYVYIIECKDGTYYTGRTWDINIRYEQHLSGVGSAYTAKHGVEALVYYEEHFDYQETCRRELQIKDWSQEKKKKILIDKFKL